MRGGEEEPDSKLNLDSAWDQADDSKNAQKDVVFFGEVLDWDPCPRGP